MCVYVYPSRAIQTNKQLSKQNNNVNIIIIIIILISTEHMGKYGVVFISFYTTKKAKRKNDDNNSNTAQTTLKASRFLCDLFVEIYHIITHTH